MKNTYWISCLAVLLLALPFSNSAFGADWYDSNWTYAKKITIDSSQVDANLSNFPVLVNVTDTDVSASAQSDCDDILFTDSTNSTKYNHEIENCDLSANDWFTAWVNIPSVSSSSDTDFFMYYGNSTVSSQENVSATWNSNYTAVWHLHDDFLDSTSNNNDLTNTGSTDLEDEYIADSQSFDGSSDDLRKSSPSSIGMNMTLSAWVRFDAVSGQQTILEYAQQVTLNDYQRISTSDTKLRAQSEDTGSSPDALTGTGEISADTWYYIVGVFRDAGDGAEIFKNGVSITTDSNPATAHASPDLIALGTRILNNEGLFQHRLGGDIDEARIVHTDLTDEWIGAEYNNQVAGSTFLTFGNEGTEPATGGSFTMDFAEDLEFDDSLDSEGDVNLNFAEDLSFDDSMDFTSMITYVMNFVEDLSFDDSLDFTSMITYVMNFVEDLSFDDSLNFFAEIPCTGGLCSIDFVEDLSFDDSFDTSFVSAIYNAIKLSLAPASGTTYETCAYNENAIGLASLNTTSRGITVPVSSDFAFSGSAGMGLTNSNEMHFLSVDHNSRIRQTGTATGVTIKTDPDYNDAALDAFSVSVWRKNGTNYDLVGTSGDIVTELKAAGGSGVELTIPFTINGVKEGDYIGYNFNGTGSPTLDIINAQGESSGTSTYYFNGTTPASSGVNWEAQSSLVDWADVKLTMDSPSIAFLGQSITAGNTFHNPYIHDSGADNPQGTLSYKISDSLGVSTQNYGNAISTPALAAHGVTAMSNFVIDQSPKVLVISYGHNDSVVGTNLATFESNLQSIVDSAKSNGMTPVLLKILRGDSFASSYNAVIDSIGTAEGISVIDATPVLADQSFSTSCVLGTFKTGYSSDTVHLTETGHTVMASFLIAPVDPIIQKTVIATSRLGGVFAGMCDYVNNYTMIGIFTNGSLICSDGINISYAP